MEHEYAFMQVSRQTIRDHAKQFDFCYSRYCSFRAAEVKKRPRDFLGIFLKKLSRDVFEANIHLEPGNKVEDIDKRLPEWLKTERGLREHKVFE